MVSKDKFIGNIDRFVNGVIEGWAVNTNNLNTSVSIDIFINEMKVMTEACHLNRQDVVDAGFGCLLSGFRVDLNHYLQFIQNINISITFSQTDIELAGSPIIRASLGHSLSLMSTQDTVSRMYPVQIHDTFYNCPKAVKLTRIHFLDEIKQHISAGGKVMIYPPLIDWNVPLFQRPQHMAKWLAKAGIKVIYLSACFKYDTTDGYYQLEDNLYWSNQYPDIYDDLEGAWITVYSTNPYCSMTIIEQWKQQGFRILYEYIDHIDPKISGDWAGDLLAVYNSLNINNVDLFLASANVLHEELQQRISSEKITLIPNGVDTEFYFQYTERSIENIQDNFQAVIKNSQKGRKVVGYFGAIAPWLDYELIQGLANNNPEFDFVYIGPPYEIDQQSLPAASNIFWIGQIEYPQLPRYAIWFDICLIPFERGNIAKTTSPLKLYEYFALGKPVVVTSAMLECTQYNFVGQGSSVNDISKALKTAIEKARDINFTQFLKQQASQHSWEKRAKDLLTSMENINVNSDKSALQLAYIVQGIALNTLNSQTISGIRIDFDLRNNKLKASLSNKAFIKGDLMSLTLKNSYQGCKCHSVITVGSNATGMHKNHIIVDYLLAGVVIKTIDYVELNVPDMLELVHEGGELFEVRYRVLKDIPESWHPADTLWLELSSYSQVSIDNIDTDNQVFLSSNPQGTRNPLLLS